MVPRVASHRPIPSRGPAAALGGSPGWCRRIASVLVAVALPLPPGLVRAEPLPPAMSPAFLAPGRPHPEAPFIWRPSAPLMERAPENAPEKPWLADEDAPLPPPDGIPVVPLENNGGAIPGIADAVGNCVITGEVSDATTLNAIGGAIVEILGTGRTVEADAAGCFRMEGLAPGSYTLEANKLGYFSENSVVTTLEGQPAEARFGLRARPEDDASAEYMLEEETVVGEYQGEGAGDLFLDLQVVPNIAAGISKEEFSKAAVSDAAGAVSKISGANIVGGKYAVIRGLGDRYSNTTVNGSLISSADPSRKAVQLDLFPSHLLESIAINKTFLPRLPAEFAGGLVAIQTLRFPDEPIVEFKYGQEIRSNLLDGDRFLTIGGRDLGFWGRTNDGALPDANFGILTPTGGGATTAERKALMEAVHASQGFRATEGKADAIEDSMEITLGRTFELSEGVKLGAVVAFSHEAGDEAILGYQVGRNFDSGAGANRREYQYDAFTRRVDWGALFGTGLKFGDQHEIGYTFFKNHSAQDTVNQASRVKTPNTAELQMVDGKMRLVSKLQPSASGPFGAAYAVYRGFDQIEPLVRDLEMNQISGTHRFGEKDRGPRFDWALAKSRSIEDRPHTSTYYYSQLDFTDPRIKDMMRIVRMPNPNAPPNFINVRLPEIYEPERGIVDTAADVLSLVPPEVESFREALRTEEHATDVNASLTLPWYFSDAGDDRFEFSFGGARLEKEREVRGKLLIYRVPSQVNQNRYLDAGDRGGQGIEDARRANSNRFPDGTDRFSGSFSDQTRPRYEDFTNRGFTERNVNAGTEVDSGFAMGSLFLNKWEIAGGVRHESETRYFELLDANENVRERGEQTNAYSLAGLTLIRPFGHEARHSVQLAWSRTVARPTFYEFAPVFTKDQASGDQIAGNPDLKDSLIQNIDLGYSFRPRPGTRLGINLFHKDIGDPIVKVLEPSGEITWVNGDAGSIQGIELEIEQRFLDRWSLTANYTYLDSLLEVTKSFAGSEIAFESTFEGQPDKIANVILGYDHEDWGLRTSLVYNYTGQYLVALANDPSRNPSVVELPRHTLDFVISKGFETFGLDGVVTFKIGNLLDSEIKRVNEGFDDTGLYDRYKPGRSYSLSCKFAF